MIRFLMSALCAFLLLGSAASSSGAATEVTEGDLKTYREIEYAQALFDARKKWARRDPAKIAAAQAEFDATWEQTGWTHDRFDEVYNVVAEVVSNIRSAREGDLSEDDLKSVLAEIDPTTVATVQAHFDELETVNDSERAEQQVREEIARDRAGAPPTRAQIEGTWAYDLDATLEAMGMAGLFQGAELEKLKADTLEKSGNPTYIFGPGMEMESRVKLADGSERVDKGTFRLEGNKIFMQATGSTREREMQVGIRNGKLVMGTGMFSAVFIRQ